MIDDDLEVPKPVQDLADYILEHAGLTSPHGARQLPSSSFHSSPRSLPSPRRAPNRALRLPPRVPYRARHRASHPMVLPVVPPRALRSSRTKKLSFPGAHGEMLDCAAANLCRPAQAWWWERGDAGCARTSEDMFMLVGAWSYQTWRPIFFGFPDVIKAGDYFM